ncbi:hypothetical protein R5W24_000494 [Gemmata sp. JC717]|nr:hypothetical protein [Gemmata algarum]MDY3551418.1 hypothetical protein [Gemmata algarum]
MNPLRTFRDIVSAIGLALFRFAIGGVMLMLGGFLCWFVCAVIWGAVVG